MTGSCRDRIMALMFINMDGKPTWMERARHWVSLCPLSYMCLAACAALLVAFDAVFPRTFLWVGDHTIGRLGLLINDVVERLL